MVMPFVLSALDRALVLAAPDICNSDQGSHFTSAQYLERLMAKEVRISMDGKGRALDNIFTERLWRTVKYEEVYLHEYDSPRAARKGLAGYFEFYNQERLHRSLGYRTPAEVYFDTTLQKRKDRKRKASHLKKAQLTVLTKGSTIIRVRVQSWS